MGLTTEHLLNTLDGMDLLDLGSPGEWDGDLDGHDTYDIDWDEVLQDRVDSTSRNQNDAVNDRWAQATEEIIKRSGGSQLPPPPISVDALAWYAPIHRFGLSWGIYIYESSIIDIAGQIGTYLKPGVILRPGITQQLSRMALSILYLHEAFHHKIESFATRLEVVKRQKVFLPYQRNVYQKLLGTDELAEEALACAEMYMRLKEKTYRHGISDSVYEATIAMLDAWIPTLPPGYRMAETILNGLSPFEENRNALLCDVNEGVINSTQNYHEWSIATQMIRGLFSWREIAHVLIPRGTKSLIPWFSGEVSPLSVSTRDLEKLIRKLGYSEITGGKGSHRKFVHNSRPTIILPNARESLSPGVLRSVARTLGVGSIRDLGALV
jgi:predicted RNA binding protein YcfA (HicA-like mRNA interferase family)